MTEVKILSMDDDASNDNDEEEAGYMYDISSPDVRHGELRGRPFDSEGGGGGLALFGNKYSDLENAGNK